MRVRGIGEDLSPLPPLPRRFLVLLKGPESLDTGAVYRRYDLSPADTDYDPDRAAAALLSPRADLRSCLVNVLQPPALSLCPRIAENIAGLTAAGASFAMMTGSGSAVYGVFDSADSADAACAVLRKKMPDAVCVRTETI